MKTLHLLERQADHNRSAPLGLDKLEPSRQHRTLLRPTKLRRLTPNENSPRASPSGQLVMNIDIAVTISRSANQSVTILVITTLIRTAPIPLISLPAVTIGNDSVAVRTPPATISDNPKRTTFLAPKRCPRRPPGSANTAPGNI